MVHPGIVAGATVTPPTVAHVPGWTSLGCYLDNLAPYQLLSANTTSKLMTPQVCETFCAAFKYFGLENGGICYCGDRLNIAPCESPYWPSYCGGTLAYPMVCDTPCSGDPTSQCGNELVLSLYTRVEPPNHKPVLPSSSSNSLLSSISTPLATTHSPLPTPSASDPHGGLSTSTIYETKFITVLSCAPTITNCPLRSVSTSLVSTPAAIVVYSTQWISSSCAAAVTNCPYAGHSFMVPITTIPISGAMPTSTLTPTNGTTSGNNTMSPISAAKVMGLTWSSFAVVTGVSLMMFWA